MAYTNAHLQLELGNVVSRIRGPAPNDYLDRTLNPHLQNVASPAEVRTARVYDSREQSFLTGALPLLQQALEAHGAPHRVVDLRESPERERSWSLREISLRPFQKEVVEKAIESGMGTIDLGTSGGKTILAAAIIAQLGLPTLYMVTTRTLLHQTVESLHRYLGFEPGVIGAGVRRAESLTVAIAQALSQYRTDDLQRWRNGVMIWDEGHHAAAPSYLELVKQIDARFNFFLSAVPFRSGDDQVVLDALTGGTLTDGEFSARYLIENGYAAPVEVRVERIASDLAMMEEPFWKIYRECVVRNAQRNTRIVEIEATARNAGESTLILVERVQHGRILQQKIRATNDSVAFAHGSVAKTQLKRMTQEFANGELRTLIATVGLFNEGVSINGITVLISAGGMKSRGKVLQAIGRGMRQAHGRGKTRCLFVDFFDDDATGVLRAHSRQRLEVLMNEGFRVPYVEGTSEPSNPPDDLAAPANEASWAHVPGTRNFVKVSEHGRVVARGECMRQELVPASLCKRCRQPWVCQRGGVTTWQMLD